MEVYANRIRQLVGLVRFQGVGLERLTKLTFITGFPDAISIGLQQVPNTETLPIGYLIVGARVLMSTGNQSQDVVTAVHPPHSSTIVLTRSNPVAV